MAPIFQKKWPIRDKTPKKLPELPPKKSQISRQQKFSTKTPLPKITKSKMNKQHQAKDVKLARSMKNFLLDLVVKNQEQENALLPNCIDLALIFMRKLIFS